MDGQYDTFCITLSEEDFDDPEKVKQFNQLMDLCNQSILEEEKIVQNQFGVSSACASNIVYLRSRSRWTPEKEAELIRMDKAGEPQPNIFEWGHDF